MIMCVAGCGGQRPRKGEPEMPLPPGVAEAPKGLKFSIKITPTKFKLGDRVSLEATMFNDSEKRFQQSFKTSCTWDYQVAAETGRIVGPERKCDPTGAEIVLEPGELRMIIRDWGAGNDYFGAPEKMSPGFYKVTAGLVDEFQRVIPMADPVTVEILP
jgi:hypothetical protein